MSLFVAVASGMDVSNVVDSTSCPNSPHATTTPHDITSLTSQPHNIPFRDITSLHIRSHDTASQYMTPYHRKLRDITPRDMTSQPTTECHLTYSFTFHQPHYSTLPRQSYDIIPQHSTSLPRKHNRPQPTLHHQMEWINAGAHQRHWVWALWCMHSFGKFFL